MSRPAPHPDDPRGLVAEAFRMADLSQADARSIFFDWALGLAAGAEAGPAAGRLLAHHADAPEGHPMRALLAEAASGHAVPRRRGGWRRARREG